MRHDDTTPVHRGYGRPATMSKPMQVAYGDGTTNRKDSVPSTRSARSPLSERSGSTTGATKYTSYKRRWLVLTVFCLLSIGNQIPYGTFTTISKEVRVAAACRGEFSIFCPRNPLHATAGLPILRRRLHRH